MKLLIDLRKSSTSSDKKKTGRQRFLSALMTIVGSEATDLAELYESDLDSDHEKLRSAMADIATRMLEGK